MIDTQEVAFNEHYARNLEEARHLRGRLVAVFGVGAVGGYTAAMLGQHGVDLLLIDRDTVSRPNLARHYLSDPIFIGQTKASALATKLRRELPAAQSIRSLATDIAVLSREQLDEIFAAASLVIAATGRDEIDRPLDTWARHRAVPILFPSLWAGETPILGDLHVVAWNVRGRRGACFACLRPPREVRPGAEAQPGLGAEVVRVAALTTEVAIGLLSERPEQAALVANLNRGVNYFLIPRWPPSLRPVLTSPRRDCRACAAGAGAAARASGPFIRTRDWVMGGSLVGTVLCHQLIPGFDYAATVVFVALAGFWWRGRLPSFEHVATVVRRHFEGS